ncbi:sugar phosphate isomerase/epimerase [Parablautia intestinalis]|uniref:Sugar phosphate isomerase/epimerase n=1 Tax=Parablautia intestinalis TaxID=2320100 RepID=A0A3A9AKM8_9FIRM|nr:sugar phosphate isomerase/epimerase family protein [Parablautia intestinalis]RKI88073.1 sugar phosphate isomerase/epimerase [Parablautia intestinalis]
MKIGVLIELFEDTDIDAKFAELRLMGMESCQLVCWNRRILHDDSAAEAVNRAVEKHGVKISAFWCGWEGRKVWDFYEGQLTLGLVPSDYRVERVKMLMEGSDFAKKIHVTDFATHVGYMPENPYDPKYAQVLLACKAVVEKCKENGQNFLFETGQETPVTLKRAIQDIEKELGKGNVGINLDPANLIMYGKANPVDALDVFGEYVRGIHGKDGLYPTDGHHLGAEVPLGQGKVNYPAFIARLKEIGYEGDITIEREISGEEQKKDILMAKEILERLIYQR